MPKMGTMEATLNQFSKLELKPTQYPVLLPWGQVNFVWKYSWAVMKKFHGRRCPTPWRKKMQ
jgi:hypothetical protein